MRCACPPPRSRRWRADLRRAFALPEGAMIDQAAIKALFAAVFERTFAVTGALNVADAGGRGRSRS